MGSPYDAESPERDATAGKKRPADPKGGGPKGMTAQGFTPPNVPGPRRQIHKPLGRRVKTSEHSDY